LLVPFLFFYKKCLKYSRTLKLKGEIKIMTYIALILGIIAAFMAWRANKKNSDLKERLAQANSRVYHLRREIQEKQEETDQLLMTLKFDVLKLQGNLKITPDMKMGEVLAVHPQAQQVLAGYHIGGCSSCATDDSQSLAEAVAVNGRQIEPILASLNMLVTQGNFNNGNGGVSPEQLKTPNIELHF